MIKKILDIIQPVSKEEQELVNIINQSYPSTKVVGRGTLVIDPKEVALDETFIEELEKGKNIVNSTKNKLK